jgi:hypothetical protein
VRQVTAQVQPVTRGERLERANVGKGGSAVAVLLIGNTTVDEFLMFTGADRRVDRAWARP